MTEGNKSRLGRRGGDEWSNRGSPPPRQGGLSEGLIHCFCLICPAFPIDRIFIQLLRNLSFRLAWTDQPIDRTDGICNAIWRGFCVLSCYVVSGNSFNASLFLFRDYPKVVNCRRRTKKKRRKEEGEEEEEERDKVHTSWRSSERRLQHRCENWDKNANNPKINKNRG